QVVQASVKSIRLQQEVEKMSKQIELTYGEELYLEMEKKVREKYETKGREEGQSQGQLDAHRQILRSLLEEKFQTLSAELLTRIEQADLPRLQAAVRQVMHIQKLEDLQL